MQIRSRRNRSAKVCGRQRYLNHAWRSDWSCRRRSRRSWRWRGRWYSASATVRDRINANVIRVDSTRTAIRDEVAERQSASDRAHGRQSYDVLGPNIWITSGRESRIDGKEQTREVTDRQRSPSRHLCLSHLCSCGPRGDPGRPEHQRFVSRRLTDHRFATLAAASATRC